MDGNEPSTIHSLKKLGMNVVLLNTQTISDIKRSVSIIAKLFNSENNIRIKELENALSKESNIKMPGIFLQIGWNPVVAAGKDSFLDELIRTSGAKNIFYDAINKYPKPSPEEVIKRNPDIIIICPMLDDGSDAIAASSFWSQFKKISAVKNKQIHIIRPDLLTKPGFSLIEGMHTLKTIIRNFSKN